MPLSAKITNKQRLFFGFSSINATSKQTSFADLDLAKRDLLVAFYTRPGTRVMMTDYGCKIWDLLFQQYDDTIRVQVIDEVERIVGYDTRFQVLDTEVTAFSNGLKIEVKLFYKPWEVIDTFFATFENDQTGFAADS